MDSTGRAEGKINTHGQAEISAGAETGIYASRAQEDRRCDPLLRCGSRLPRG